METILKIEHCTDKTPNHWWLKGKNEEILKTNKETGCEPVISKNNKKKKVVWSTEEGRGQRTFSFLYSIHLAGWWRYVVAALGSLGLVIILVAVITWKRAKGGNIHRWNLDRKHFWQCKLSFDSLSLCLCDKATGNSWTKTRWVYRRAGLSLQFDFDSFLQRSNNHF